MKAIFVVLAAIGTISSTAIAAEKFQLRTCSSEESKDLDISAMDQIKANNFSDGAIYTASRLTFGAESFTGQLGMMSLVLSKKGLQISGFELCTRNVLKITDTFATPNISLDSEVFVGAIVKNTEPAIVSLVGTYLNSDDHVALKGSKLEIAKVKSEDDTIVLKLALTLNVANKFTAENEGKNANAYTATEILNGTFYVSVMDAMLK